MKLKTILTISIIFIALAFKGLMSCNVHKDTDFEIKMFLKEQKMSAKEYILSLFEKQDIVIICERHHAELEK